MKIALAIAATVFVLTSGAQASGTNWVRGHVRKDGTYVPPHIRTNPDSSRYNNYSSTPNVNPYTGRAGTVNPNPYGYSAPSTNRSYGSGSTYGTPSYGNGF